MCPNLPMSTTNARINSQQNLLSTIYKQSWHPVASTKHTLSRNGPKRPRDNNIHAGNLQKPVPFQGYSEYNQTKNYRPKESRFGPSVKDRYRENSRPFCSDSGSTHDVPCTVFTTANKTRDIDAQSAPSVTSLATWKKQLKTCVESNSRDFAIKIDSNSRAERAKQSVDRVLALRRQQFWSTDSTSAKCYKILNYQNSTLSSICVQGRDPPVKSRPDIVPRLRTHSTSSSLTSNFEIAQPERRDSFSSVANEQSDSKPMSSSTNDESFTKRHDTNFETSRCSSEDDDNDDVICDDVFSANDVINEEAYDVTISNDCIAEEETNLDLMDLNFDKNEAEPSDIESDISEQEMSSDEEDGIPDPVGNDEQNRLEVEKCKELYKNENISKSKSSDTKQLPKTESTTKKSSIGKEKSKSDKPNGSQTYEFASVFPRQFQKYNLKELSLLPYDVNWREVVKISDLCPERKAWKKDGYVAKQRRARSSKAQEERNKMETLVDRMLVLEKFQATTRRAEYMSRYHVAHVRAAAARQKAQQNSKTPTTTAVNNNTNDSRQNGSTSDPSSTVPRTPSRRRSSVPLASARLAWANQITQGEHMKEAHRSRDFSAVIDNWSAKNRPAKINNDKRRRSSESSIKKSRLQLMHPRFYDYHWSEKTKDDKIRPSIQWNSRLRSCQTCKEKWRKLTSAVLQERRQRPSTAGSVCFNTARPSTVPVAEKNFVRPKSTGFPLPMSLMTSSSNFYRTNSKSKNCSNNDNSTNSNFPVSGNCYVIKEHVVSEETNVIPPSRQTYLTSAFRVTSAPFSKRPQTSWSST